MTIPAVDDLRSSAEEALRRCGADVAALAGDRPVRSPVNGHPLCSIRWQTAADVEAACW